MDRTEGNLYCLYIATRLGIFVAEIPLVAGSCSIIEQCRRRCRRTPGSSQRDAIASAEDPAYQYRPWRPWAGRRIQVKRYQAGRAKASVKYCSCFTCIGNQEECNGWHVAGFRLQTCKSYKVKKRKKDILMQHAITICDAYPLLSARLGINSGGLYAQLLAWAKKAK